MVAQIMAPVLELRFSDLLTLTLSIRTITLPTADVPYSYNISFHEFGFYARCAVNCTCDLLYTVLST